MIILNEKKTILSPEIIKTFITIEQNALLSWLLTNKRIAVKGSVFLYISSVKRASLFFHFFKQGTQVRSLSNGAAATDPIYQENLALRYL